MIMKKIHATGLLMLFTATLSFAQKQEEKKNEGIIHGFFQVDAQTYTADSASGITQVPEEKAAMMAFGNITFRKGNFEAGIRYEAFLPPLLGLDQRYDGQGIANRYAKYKGDKYEITLGNFYEQFGSGMILRSYWEWTLGLDNSIDGIRLKYNPVKGVSLTGLFGKQRYFWDSGAGTVRGLNGEFSINELFKSMEESKTIINLGGSFVSKFQPDNNPLLNLPVNVAAFSGRFKVQRGKVSLGGEYAYKANDPSGVNGQIYRAGQGLLLNFGYTQKGFGVNLSAKRLDNMSFKSDRDEGFFNLDMNYLPALTRVHTYRLPTLYPYATQPNGEMAIQADVIYRIKKGSALGGKYGTTVSLNYSLSNAIKRDAIADSVTSQYQGYESSFFAVGKQNYWQDLNIEVSHKFSKKVKATASYINLHVDSRVINVVPDFLGNIYTHIGIIDVSYKVKKKQIIRGEIQHLWSKQDRGNWAMAMVEYTFAPKFTISFFNEWNYNYDLLNAGNTKETGNLRTHYPSGSFIYQEGNTRITLGYGKQRAGVICVGGVCRNVPASNGASINITTNF